MGPSCQKSSWLDTARRQETRMVSQWFLLKAVGPWRGMWQLFAPRLTLTLISPSMSWPCGGDGSLSQRGEIGHFADTMTSSRSRSRLWVLLVSRPLLWVGKFRSWSRRTESLSFYFSAFLSIFSSSTQCSWKRLREYVKSSGRHFEHLL